LEKKELGYVEVVWGRGQGAYPSKNNGEQKKAEGKHVTAAGLLMEKKGPAKKKERGKGG